MINSVKAGFNQALTLGFVGIFVGAVGGWYGALSENGPDLVAEKAAPFFILMALAIPATQFFLNWRIIDKGTVPDARIFTDTTTTHTMLQVAAIGGGLISAVLFLVGAAYVPGILSSEDPLLVREALADRFEIGALLAVLAGCVVGAFFIGRWAIGYMQTADRSPEAEPKN